MGALGPNEADTCRDYIVPRLRAAGWSPEEIVEEHYFTDGRVVASLERHRREPGRRADYLLEIAPGVPIAVVEAKRLYKLPGDGLQQGMDYAEILRLPVAYSSNGRGIVEHDYTTGAQRALEEFPSKEEMWDRFRSWVGLTAESAAAVKLGFNRDLRGHDGTVKTPRYYQAIAINTAVQRILAGDKRVLLTMATGTGKTFVALQIVWKLWELLWPSGRRPRVLYLADRTILIDQPIVREFRPVFGDAVWKLSGEPQTGRELYFALYQSLADDGAGSGMFRHYPSDYFDLIVVDEAHRGSARDESSWRGVLDHFSSAAQLGLTATPLRTDNVDTYRYFGEPAFEYSLAQGVDDGFLAPYRVRRVVLDTDIDGWVPPPEQRDLFGREIPPNLYTPGQFERVVSLLMRTRAAARHLTEYMRQTDRYGKTIVFCVDQEHAEQMRQELHNANADLTKRLPHYVARIVADEGDVGRRLLDQFADPESESPVIVTTSRLLSTGVDVPTCTNVVLFRPIGSMVEFKQIIGRGTRLFADPDFDGSPEEVVEESIDEAGSVVESEVTWSEPVDTGDLDPGLQIPADRTKYYVDDGEVVVTAEAVYLLQEGRGLQVIAYDDYVATQVRRLFASSSDLRAQWRSKDGRDAVVTALASRGIDFHELAASTGLSDADPFDLLVHLAWNAPVTSRRQRADRIARGERGFWERYPPAAREVLEELLEKYAEHGIAQLDDLRVLEVPPLNQFGTVVEIAQRFGGGAPLREAVAELEDLLYAA